jgi:cytidyltransferase-like protein
MGERGYLPHELPIEAKLSKAYIGGTFDLLHPGHLFLLERVKAYCGLVVVSLNTDEFNERYKDRAPVMNLHERMRMVKSLRCVDGVMVNEHGEDSKPGVIAAGAVGNPGDWSNPVTHIVHGADWQGESLMKQLQVTPEWLEEHGIEMLYIDLSEGYSTTSIKQRIFDAMRGPDDFE